MRLRPFPAVLGRRGLQSSRSEQTTPDVLSGSGFPAGGPHHGRPVPVGSALDV